MVHIAPQYGTYRKVIRGILASRFVFFVKPFEFADERFLIFCCSGTQETTKDARICHAEMAKWWLVNAEITDFCVESLLSGPKSL